MPLNLKPFAAIISNSSSNSSSRSYSIFATSRIEPPCSRRHTCTVYRINLIIINTRFALVVLLRSTTTTALRCCIFVKKCVKERELATVTGATLREETGADLPCRLICT